MSDFQSELNRALNSAFELYKNDFERQTSNLKKINLFFKKKLTKFQDFSGPASKCDDQSTNIRKTGNAYFYRKDFLEALEFYTWAVAGAETPEVAALAYSNRSGLLSLVGLHKECLIDVDRALQNDYPEESRAKLLLRKVRSRQILNRIRAEPQPPPEESPDCFQIQRNENFGRHIIAKKNINIGDVIVSEQPFAAVLLQDYFMYCHDCLTLCYNLIPCASCPKSLYCSEACSAQAYRTYHKYECGILNHGFYTQNYELMLALKITLKVMTQMREENFEVKEKLKRMLTHSNKRSLKDSFMLAWSTSVIFTRLNEETTLFTDFPNFENIFKDLFLTTLEIIDINAVSINRVEPTSDRYDVVRYGCGLYFNYSLINHSCSPNAFFYHDGTKLVVRALETIKRGQQCFISYGCTFSTTDKLTRQSMLREKYHFTCMCVACRDNWPEETENHAFDTPFACVQLAIERNDWELLKNMLPTFTRNLKRMEGSAPAIGITCLKQLVVDCYQVYETPRKVFEEKME